MENALSVSRSATEVDIQVDQELVPIPVIPATALSTDEERTQRDQYETLFLGILKGRQEEVSGKTMQLRALLTAAEEKLYETFHPSQRGDRVIGMDEWLSLLHTKLGVPFAAKSTFWQKVEQVKQAVDAGLTWERATEIAADKPYAITAPQKAGAFEIQKEGSGFEATYTIIPNEAPDGKDGMGLRQPKDYIEWVAAHPQDQAIAMVNKDFGKHGLTCRSVIPVQGSPEGMSASDFNWVFLEMVSLDGTESGTPLRAYLALEKEANPKELAMFVKKIKPSWVG